MSKEKDIQNNSLSQEKLLAYLEGKLSAEEQREVEALLSEDGADADAIEGLKDLTTADAHVLANRIDYTLLHELRKNKHKGRKKLSADKWTWLAVLIILLLAIVTYFIMYIQVP